MRLVFAFLTFIYLTPVDAGTFFQCRDIHFLNRAFVLEGSPFFVVQRGTTQIEYLRTNRGLDEMHDDNVYPRSFLRLSSLKGKRILDAGCGDGKLVYQMRAAGIDAIGVDIVLNERQLREKEIFQQGDLRRLELPDESVDVIYSSWSVFSYEKDAVFLREVAAEFKRVLKPRGVIRISPVDQRLPEGRDVRRIFRDLGLRTFVPTWVHFYRPPTISPRSVLVRKALEIRKR